MKMICSTLLISCMSSHVLACFQPFTGRLIVLQRELFPNLRYLARNRLCTTTEWMGAQHISRHSFKAELLRAASRAISTCLITETSHGIDRIMPEGRAVEPFNLQPSRNPIAGPASPLALVCFTGTSFVLVWLANDDG